MDNLRKIFYEIRGTEDRELFPIIKRLISKVNNGIFYVDDDCIVYNDHTDGVSYVYSIGSGEDEDNARTMSMEAKGASWFREMRGDGVADENIKASNKWQTLITKLSEEFYKNNPILYYEDTKTELNKNSAIDASIKRIVKMFFDEEDVSVEPSIGESSQLIYAASLKLAVGVSVGMPRPVLGKVYFSMNADKTLEFLSKEEARKIEDNLSRITMNKQALPSVNLANIAEDIGSVVTNLQGMLTEREHLEENLLFNDDNSAVIKTMTEKLLDELQDDDVQVEISKVTVNTIFMITVKASNYSVKFNKFSRLHKPVLKARVLFDKVTLNCEACRSHEELIRANVIEYTDAEGIKRKAEIVLGEEDVGIRLEDGVVLCEGDEGFEETVNQIRADVFSKHLFKVHCDACGCRSSCYGYVCKDQQINALRVAFNGSTTEIVKCADCIYPESYVYVEGVPYVTDSVYFDVNTHRLAVDTHDGTASKVTCPVCGRAYARNPGRPDDRCDLCASLSTDNPLEVKKQKSLYGKYSGLLPLRTRLFRAGKRCVEDQSMIVFKIGKTYHIYDKLQKIISGDDFLVKTTVVYDENGEVQDE